jgi:hypothetical protein
MANLNSSASQLNANLNSAPGFGTQFLQALPSRIQMAKDIASMSAGVPAGAGAGAGVAGAGAGVAGAGAGVAGAGALRK